MIELIDTQPDVNVQQAEYARLLGYPRGAALSERALELAAWVRDWYAKNGRSWIYARQAESLEVAEGCIRIDGTGFSSPRLENTLRQAEAHSAVVVAVGAGPELEREAQKLWAEEKPDEYFFLEVFGSAVVEHLTTMAGAKLCAWAEDRQMAVLPHYSPGYPEWDIAEQPRLLRLMRRAEGLSLPFDLDVLDSGALRPKKSLLAVFGLTRHTEHLRRLTDLVPCENCSFTPCQFRRAPYREGAPRYSANAKALRRWAAERLSLNVREDGAIEAVFRYEGTTCTNMGRPLRFDYSVTLGPREDGFPIREQRCGPVPGDAGYTSMCRYIEDREQLLAAIDDEKPLLGRPLSAVLSWRRPVCAAGCYCEPAGRGHKWGLVLETIHYALAHRGVSGTGATEKS
jgi:hypothetical protein